MAKKKKKKKSNVVLNIFIALVFLAGAGVFLYPTISDMWNQYRNAQLVSKYEEAVTELSDNDYDRLWKEAKAPAIIPVIGSPINTPTNVPVVNG